MNNTITSILTIIGAILSSTAVTALITAFVERRKRGAETNGFVVDSALDVAKGFRELRDEMEKAKSECMEEVSKLKLDLERRKSAIETLQAKVLQLQQELDNVKKERDELRKMVEKLQTKTAGL